MSRHQRRKTNADHSSAVFARRWALVGIFVLAACSSQGRVPAPKPIEPDPIEDITGGESNWLDIAGVVEKGPMIAHSQLRIDFLTAAGEQALPPVYSQLQDDLGSYHLRLDRRTLGQTSYMVLQAKGSFFDEGRHIVSSDEISLTAVVARTNGGSMRVNINALTELSAKRSLELLRQGVPITHAITEAEKERDSALALIPSFRPQRLATRLLIVGGVDVDDAYLLWTSAVISQVAIEQTLTTSQWIGELSKDFADDGYLELPRQALLAEASTRVESQGITDALSHYVTERVGNPLPLPDLSLLLSIESSSANCRDGCPIEIDESVERSTPKIGISSDGTQIAVGIPQDSEYGRDAGAVHIYGRDMQNGRWTHRSKFFAPTPQASERFGDATASSGPWLVVGAHVRTVTIANNPPHHLIAAGGADIYGWDQKTRTWRHVQTLTSDVPRAHEHFGRSVALSGHDLYLGARSYANDGGLSGVVYHFRYYPDLLQWRLHQKLVSPDLDSTNTYRGNFGLAVVAKETVLAIGAPNDNQRGVNAGGVYVYQRQPGMADWVFREKLLPSSSNGNFGTYLDLSTRFLAAGTRALLPASQIAIYEVTEDASHTNLGIKLAHTVVGANGAALNDRWIVTTKVGIQTYDPSGQGKNRPTLGFYRLTDPRRWTSERNARLPPLQLDHVNVGSYSVSSRGGFVAFGTSGGTSQHADRAGITIFDL